MPKTKLRPEAITRYKMPATTWILPFGKKEYTIVSNVGFVTSKVRLFANGDEIKLPKPSFKELLTGRLDLPFCFDGYEGRLVHMGLKTDIAIEGIYLKTGTDYTPPKGIPWWSWLFVALCILSPAILTKSLLAAIVGACGAVYCIRASYSPFHGTLRSVLTCVGIYILTWVAVFVWAFILDLL